VELFARQGFFRDARQDVSYVAPHAIIFRRQNWSSVEVAAEYERAWWQAQRSGEAARMARDRLEKELDVLRPELERLQTELSAGHDFVLGLEAERDRVISLLSVAEADFQARLGALASESTRPAPEPVPHAPATTPRGSAHRFFAGARQLASRARGRISRTTMVRKPQATGDSCPEEPPPATDYAHWIALFDTPSAGDGALLEARLRALPSPPSISIVMPVFNPAEAHLRAAIESVLNQSYANFELCIADDASTEPWVGPILAEFEARDQRVRVERRRENGHIALATNSALVLASGEWVGFLDHDDLLAPDALATVALWLDRAPQAAIVYSDEDKVDESGTRSGPYFKPDWDPLLILGQNYVTHFCLIRRSLIERVGRCREGLEGAQDWDLVLRASERVTPDQIVHIPRILYHWRAHEASTARQIEAKPYAAGAGRRAVADHISRTGRHGDLEPLGRLGFQRVRWHLTSPPPMVSVVIPTRNGQHLVRCVESVLYRTTYPDYEVLLVDNGTSDFGLLRYLGDHAHQLRIVRDARAFNFSALNNAAVEQARGEVVCFLNDDVEVISNDWLESLVGQLTQPGVGIAGAKLYFPDGLIQHAGVVLGIGGVAGHAFRGADRLEFGHFGHAVLARSTSAVTAACMVVRHSVWTLLGGLDEALAVSYNDVDFCLRARQHGWRTVWTPEAELFHFESATRGDDTDPSNRSRALAEYQMMLSRWGDDLAYDPFYNPNLTLERGDYSLALPPRSLRGPVTPAVVGGTSIAGLSATPGLSSPRGDLTPGSSAPR
jgi:GT2 family glycosyltransferase